ncbi:MAG: ABC transporter permease [Gemmatimonadaceae bacterium]
MNWRRLISLPRRTTGAIARDVDDELQFHLRAREDDLIAAGMSPEAARARARQDFGDVEDARRYATDIDRRTEGARHRRDVVGEFRQDVTYTLRALRSSPGFALTALATLALGIGATTGIFSVVNGVLLRPLPYPDAGQLYRVWTANKTAGALQATTSAMDLDDWRAQRERLVDLGGYWFQTGGSGLDLTGMGEPQRLAAVFITPGFFRTMGVAPVLGRLPRDEELVRGGPDRIVLLTHAFWQRQFGGRNDVVGRTLTLNNEAFTVIGVLPSSFAFPTPHADLFASFSLFTDDQIPRLRFVRLLGVVARARAGMTEAAVTAELQTITRRLAARYPENAAWDGVTVRGLKASITGDVTRSLWVLFGAVAVLLMIACVNVASLQLSRATARAGEIAVRSALGASRARLIRQLLTESVVLATVGGVLGILVAVLTVRGIAGLAADQLPRGTEVMVDARALLFALMLSLVTGVAFGLFPALRVARDLQPTARGTRGIAGPSRGNLRHALVISEVALVMVLVTAGGLMLRSLRELNSVDPGFRTDHLLVMNFTISTDRQGKDYTQAYTQILDRVRALPGVAAAGAAKDAPFRGSGESIGFRLPGMVIPAGEDSPASAMLNISDGFFKAIGARLISGREFARTDRRGTPLVCVVNQAFAKRWFPGQDVVGKRLLVGDTTQVEIVGLVNDIRQTEVASDAAETVYLHELQNSRVRMTLLVRTVGEPLQSASAVRAAIHEVDPQQTITETTTMEVAARDALARPRLVTTLLGAFGSAGLLFGALGLYGVLAYLVQQRRRELGVRLALGASQRRVLQMVVRQGLRLTAIGVAIGTVAALASGRVLSSVLFGVKATDPATYLAVVAVLFTVAWIASLLPARRAASVDVVETLRAD